MSPCPQISLYYHTALIMFAISKKKVTPRARPVFNYACAVVYTTRSPDYRDRAMKLLEWSKCGILLCVFFLFAGIGTFLRHSCFAVTFRRCECTGTLAPRLSGGQTASDGESRGGPRPPGPPYLSYQPPGNGWNNQRIALENALVLAKLLNRTLIVHPLAPHSLGERLKAKHGIPGYRAYNMLSPVDLLPPTSFLDLQLMSQIVPVLAINSSHPQFLRDYSHLTWKNVCHSAGFGFWVERPPSTSAEVKILSKQKFIPNNIWKGKCPEEQKRAQEDPKSPIVRFVSDIARDSSDMLYFEQGTLFAVSIRFWTRWAALEAQRWVVNGVRYSKRVWRTARAVAAAVGPQFNAIHVRRQRHVDQSLSATYWLDRMAALNFSTSIPLYVATDRFDVQWFAPFLARGYLIFTAADFSKGLLDFSFLPASLRGDYLGLHEQCICELAERFVPSPSSTFALFILRRRGEAEERDGLMTSTLHTYWAGHQLKHLTSLQSSSPEDFNDTD